MRFTYALTAFAAVPMVALAVTIQPGDLYTDVRATSPEAAGINMLTREGIVKGYGNGFFGVSRTINRAEFLKIAMKTFGGEDNYASATCFPDVRSTDWFSPFVCAAKDRGVVKGFNDGLFHPEYTVTYGEALKMLDLLYGYDVPQVNGAHWADHYYRAAAAKGLDLPITITLDTPLTRGLAARLAAAFLAESQGQLEQLRRAEAGEYSSSSAAFCGGIAGFQCSSGYMCIDNPNDSCDPMNGGADCGGMCVPNSSSSSSRSSSNSSSSSTTSGPIDPIADTSVRSQIILLGETTPVLGAGKIFLALEPLQVTEILVNLTSETPTVSSLLIYDEDRRLLGRANLDPSASTNRTYKLTLSSSAFAVEKNDERTIYVRADLRSKSNGGLSNQWVQVSSIVVKGNGVWSNNPYTSIASGSQDFPLFLTARASIISVTNAGQATAGLVSGAAQNVGSFTLTGRKTDSTAHIDVTSLVFDIQQTGGVTLSNVTLGADGLNERFPCTATSTQITCSAVPETYGSLTDGPRTLTVYATITITSTDHASLRLALNLTGSALSAGAVTWTDSTATFTWVPVANGPLGEGTLYRF